MIHGVDFNEDANPSPYTAWVTALTTGFQAAGYTGNISASPTENGVRYNDIFDQYPRNVEVCAKAATELIKSAVWYSIIDIFSIQEFGFPSDDFAKAPAQPKRGILSELKWTVGQVAQWIAEDGLRANCRKRVYQQIQETKPDVILAHSLGSLLCYDLFANGSNGKAHFKDIIFVTFGSQIANLFIRDRIWHGGIKMINVKMWYNLYNPHDPVFVSPIELAAPNFHQFVIHPPFGGFFDLSAHEPTSGKGHAGYLDNHTTNTRLWPALAGGTTASLIKRNIEILKRASLTRAHSILKSVANAPSARSSNSQRTKSVTGSNSGKIKKSNAAKPTQ